MLTVATIIVVLSIDSEDDSVPSTRVSASDSLPVVWGVGDGVDVIS